MTASDVTVSPADYDPADQEGLQDPQPMYRALRAARVAYSEKQEGGFYALARYEDVHGAARDWQTFSSADGITLPAVGNPEPFIPIEVDPPRLQEYRRILAPLFTPAKTKEMVPELRRIAREIIDDIAKRNSCEFVDEFAYMYPTVAMYRSPWMGEPLEGEKLDPEGSDDWAQNLRDSVRTFIHGFGEPSARIAGLIIEYSKKLLEHRRANPADDIPTYLLKAEINGRKLTEAEMLNTLLLQFNAGPPTTGAFLSGAFWFLAQRPDLQEVLAGDPTKIPLAMEELLRYLGPTQVSKRTTTRPVTVGGTEIPAKCPVGLVWAAANRDEAEFPNAEEFVLDRFPNRHIAFGMGVHRCIGSNVARALIQISLEEWFRQIPKFSIRPGSPTPWDVGISRNLQNLELVW
ncbi:cytochrome P450 [Mycolicibacterium thermoresistibile]|uniref:Putative cytochrome P450 n=2 Tax=Mycolicibacterium thermoresistibile TaxID=1797 RepID=G7CH24_MYCT3|nr:cytochrome P450 [Mycolicibacterium thermoresistibile]EHI12134.1 putative cytochrome P450 [Mycolicibacterium thermoresistibile ATCC 19527]MCV7191151.1 cytochrome P450 [Mycolicibacterium thermoresistibile]GAT15501.1 putative cytochrome P450 [Mycolicibacterium thermoresistibile]SNW16948.1 cytochrome P450 superfamily protein [Mycolicibacterium thermoresistibile]